ncbi:MAG: aminotransferase class I/II-fold pyridoxal phosphate-dependent enzyme [Deltaproteobacteria bacterium]|nr:aminotransferase class I/II-fold pyridoxal phosphate-dependent enzyme [Deltaproteobacteria bacterium]
MSDAPVDLRSDTLTRPTAAMRRVMAEAEVGDDCYREDPTARALEERVAELFGKPAALFMPSGTMANQCALQVHCRHGEEVVVGEGAHCFYFEGGAGGAFAGVQFVPAGRGGLFDVADLEAAVKPQAYYLPRTALVALENTHNLAGGVVFPQAQVVAIAERARELGLALHLDGARIWNAHVATGLSLAELAAPFDTLSVCFSKGLGAPIGSVLLGSQEQIAHALRVRRMFGGALRQVGVLCAAMLYALDHHLEALSEDHANAQRLAQGVAGLPGVRLDPASVQTNIVAFELERLSAADFVAGAAAEGVLLGAVGVRRVRAVTHRDVDAAAIDRALGSLSRVPPF